MRKVPKSILWVLAGVMIGLAALSIFGSQALAQEPPPGTDILFPDANMGSTHFGLNWNVAGTGGGTISSTHFKVSSTIGQPTVGTTNSTHFEVCTGYWCWLERIAEIFLPLVIKS